MKLENLGYGAAAEKFEDAVIEVVKNIQDPNTDWKTARQINMTVSFSPDENRREAKMMITVSTKLVGRKPYTSTVLVGIHRNGDVEAREIQQMGLFDGEKDDAEKKVYTIKKEETQL
jgi:hypothetical protein